MSNMKFTSDDNTRSKRNNYRFNIAKECPICGKSFITDIFEEEDNCSECTEIYHAYEDESFKHEVLDDLFTQGWSRSVAVRYD